MTGSMPRTAARETLRRGGRTTLRTPRARREQTGIALVLVLWLTVLLTVIAGGFAYSMRTEAMAARNAVSIAQARALADGAVMRVTFDLMRPRTTSEVWQADGMVHQWDEGEAHVLANATDESGRIDLNTATDQLLWNLLRTAGGMDNDPAARLVSAIDDWKSPGDIKRLNGAKAAEYEAAGLPYKPPNAPFETVVELQRVLGMTPAVYQAVADSLTVFSRLGSINPAFASRIVLLSVPGATAEIVDAYIPRRDAALANHLPPPPFPVPGVLAAQVNAWRIRAEVTMPDGAAYAREAVVRVSGNALHPLTMLVWQEGAQRVLTAPVTQ